MIKNVTIRKRSHHLAIDKRKHKRPTKLSLEYEPCDECKVLENEFHFAIMCNKLREHQQNIFGEFITIHTGRNS